MLKVVQINTLQRRLCTVIWSSIHPRNKEQSSTVVSFDLQLPAPTCDELDKRFCRQVFISHKKPWRKIVVWLKRCAKIQETKVHRYNSTKCLAGAFFRLVSTSQATPRPLEGDMHWYLQSIQTRGKKHHSQQRNTLPETITYSPKHFPSQLPIVISLLSKLHHRRKTKPDRRRK